MSNMNSTQQRLRGSARRSVLVKAAALALAIATFASVQQDAYADPVSRAQAKRMYDRLVGTPPTPALLDELEQLVAADKVAAGMYMLDPSSPRSSQFYTTTLKNFATPWTNRDQTVFAPLNARCCRPTLFMSARASTRPTRPPTTITTWRWRATTPICAWCSSRPRSPR
jgi:hypothetical protein